MADDYITKPFSMLILGKRITALLRRSQNKPAVNTVKLGDIRYAPAHYSNHVENISDFYTLLRHYIGIVFILFFKRHNHSDIIALKIRKSNVEIGARRKSGCIVNG